MRALGFALAALTMTGACYGARKAQVLCAHFVVARLPDGRAESSQYRCIAVEPSNLVTYPMIDLEATERFGWVSSINPNEVGATYVSEGEFSSGEFSGLQRALKPVSSAANAHMVQVFADDLMAYQNANVNASTSVEENLEAIRHAAANTAGVLEMSVAARISGAPSVVLQQTVELQRGLAETRNLSIRTTSWSDGLASHLRAAPNTATPIDLVSLRSRSATFATETQIAAATAVQDRPLISHPALASNNARPSSSLSLRNAIRLQRQAYAEVDPSSIKHNTAYGRGRTGVDLADFYWSRNEQIADVLLTYSVNAFAYAKGEASRLDEPGWNADQQRWALMKDVPDGQSLLSAATLVQSWSQRAIEATQPSAEKHKETAASVSRITRELVERAQLDLASDPRRTLGGLFRARTLADNARLYGDTVTELHSWVPGNAGRFREVLEPKRVDEEDNPFESAEEMVEGLEKALSITTHSLLGDDQANDVFGAEALATLKDSIRGAIDVVRHEPVALPALDDIAPTMDMWLDGNVRAARAESTKKELVELQELRDLYSARADVLDDFAKRMDALDRLSWTFSSELEGLVPLLQMFGSAASTKGFANAQQLGDVSSLSHDGAAAMREAAARYRSDLVRVDMLIDGWTCVLPEGCAIRFSPYAPLLDQLRRHP